MSAAANAANDESVADDCGEVVQLVVVTHIVSGTMSACRNGSCHPSTTTYDEVVSH